MRRILGNENEAHIVPVNGFKQKEDLKMYRQLPDYDDFQGYDLGAGGVSSRIPHKIYANFHKPSRITLKHHLFMAETQRNPKEIDDVAENDKRAISNRKGSSAGYRIPIANTFGELAEMDFSDCGDFPRPCAFVTLSTFPGYYFLRGEKRKRPKRQRWRGGK